MAVQEMSSDAGRWYTRCFKEQTRGLSMCMASVFVAGQMAGSGLVTLPHALVQSGWMGIVLIFVCCFNSLFSGICLGRCWLILEERWKEHRDKCRNPYPTIASRAVGPWMSYVSSFCIDFSMFGAAIVFLLISAQIFGNMTLRSGLASCHWVLILAAGLWPLMWFGTPEDFWPAAVFALSTTTVASVLLLVGILKDNVVIEKEEKYFHPDLQSFALSFATILFAFGGVSSFPTFHNDMKNKQNFPRSACLAFACLMALYTPVAVCGYFVYGSAADANIVMSLSSVDSGFIVAIELLLASHLLFAFVLVINIPAQELEEFFQVPTKFGWKRCVFRSVLMVLVVFVALSIPNFGKILELVGASTITLTTFVFPPIFYLLLINQKDPDWPNRSIPVYESVYLWFIIAVGIVGGTVSTYSAISDMIQEYKFSVPCYMNMTVAG